MCIRYGLRSRETENRHKPWPKEVYRLVGSRGVKIHCYQPVYLYPGSRIKAQRYKELWSHEEGGHEGEKTPGRR